jgi:hypothetical protein
MMMGRVFDQIQTCVCSFLDIFVIAIEKALIEDRSVEVEVQQG